MLRKGFVKFFDKGKSNVAVTSKMIAPKDIDKPLFYFKSLGRFFLLLRICFLKITVLSLK